MIKASVPLPQWLSFYVNNKAKENKVFFRTQLLAYVLEGAKEPEFAALRERLNCSWLELAKALSENAKLPGAYITKLGLMIPPHDLYDLWPESAKLSSQKLVNVKTEEEIKEMEELKNAENRS